MKVNIFIEIIQSKNYEEPDLYIYWRLIEKLICLLYDTRPDTVFIIRQFSRYNTNPRKSHL